MKKELNLQCLYKVYFDEATYIYNFTTKNNILYEVVFYDFNTKIIEMYPLHNIPMKKI